MKSVIALFFLSIVAIYISLAYADSRFASVSIPLTTDGVNWSIPEKTSDLKIQANATNWADITFFQGTGINWSNNYRINPGGSYELGNVWSANNKVGIRGQSNQDTANITYSQSN